jgi:hypothetical protein
VWFGKDAAQREDDSTPPKHSPPTYPNTQHTHDYQRHTTHTRSRVHKGEGVQHTGRVTARHHPHHFFPFALRIHNLFSVTSRTMVVMGTTTARVFALGTSRYDCSARLWTPYMPRSHTPENGRNSWHEFNTKAVSHKLPQNTVSVSHPEVHSGIVKTRDAPWIRLDTGVQHTGKACAAGWCACGVGWISTTTGPISTVPFGGANVGLGRETAGPNGGVARSKTFHLTVVYGPESDPLESAEPPKRGFGDQVLKGFKRHKSSALGEKSMENLRVVRGGSFGRQCVSWHPVLANTPCTSRIIRARVCGDSKTCG